ncbi:EF-hand domain-containing protein [Colwellia echini]|uniref:EF-hand domain-containing protein n=1 Tax=Colwellia echini TaxID=1982103 RepID=A0ABY3MTL2_9GAMM|nr:EF-hand domain-containing protein [Colwellia echini]TYK64519.1 EF-hand domain-containing protein [Colwellia echini]
MNHYTKLVLAITLTISATSIVHADNSERSKNGPPQRPTFESIDINEDGEIDFDEFSSHEVPHGDYETVFNMIDIDGDGIITVEEFESHKPPKPKKRGEKEQ